MLKRSVAYVILSCQSANYLADCLQSVCAMADEYQISIFIYDNGSTDESVKVAETLKSQYSCLENYQIVKSDKNVGTTKSRNILLRMIPAATEYVCVIDSDTIINSASIGRMISALEFDARNLIAAPRMFNSQLIEQRSVKRFPTVKLKLLKGLPCDTMNQRGEAMESYPFMPDRVLAKHPLGEGIVSCSAALPVSEDDSVYPVDYAISACWLMKRAALDLVGYLDERIFYAPEDVDYCARIKRAGYKVVLASNASIFHFTQRISKRRLFSRMNLHHITGLLYYFLKHRKLKRYL